VAARTSSAVDQQLESGIRQVRPVVTIVCGGRSVALDLRRLKATRFQNLIVVRLDSLWFDSKLGADLSSLRFDFVGEDGFRPTRVGHELLPGEALKHGYLNTRSRTLLWDDPTIDPAFAVQGVTMIVAHSVP
jgi:hypothetical protein